MPRIGSKEQTIIRLEYTYHENCGRIAEGISRREYRQGWKVKTIDIYTVLFLTILVIF